MKVFVALMIVSMSFCGLSKAEEDVAVELKKLEQQLAEAILKQDVEAVRRIEAETYVHTDAEGKVNTREDFVRSYRSGSGDIKSLQFDQIVADVYDKAAVIRGITRVHLLKEGTTVTRVGRYTRFYVRFDDGWRAVAGHSSAIPNN